MIVTIKKSGKTEVGTITLQGAGDYNFVKSGSNLIVEDVNYVTVNADNKKFEGTTGKDYITNADGHDGVSMQGGKGDDTFEGSTAGEVFMFSYGSGNDVITNFGESDSLICTSGSISAVDTEGDDVIVTLKRSKQTEVGKITLQGAAALNLKKTGTKLTVETVNTITSNNDGETLRGSDGRDLINSTNENVVIIGSAGDDTITGSDTFGELYQFTSLDGGNVITNFGSADTLQITKGSIYSTVLSNDKNDLIVKTGKASTAGKITLQGAGDFYERGLLIKSGKYLFIDDIEYVVNRNDNAKKSGSSNKRTYLVNSGDNVTLGGGGSTNDTLEGTDGKKETYLFGAASGEDLILNFGEEDTLYVNSGSISSRERVGNDYVVDVKSSKASGSVTLKGAGRYVFDQGGKNNGFITVRHVNYVNNDADGVKVTGTGGADYIFNGGQNVSIQAGKGDDTIEGSNYGEVMMFSYASDNDVVLNFGKNDSLVSTSGKITAVENVGNDTTVTIKKSKTTSTVTLNNTKNYFFEYNDTLLTVNDINVIDNGDDGAMLTGTSGRDYIINTGENVTIQAGAGNDTIDGSDKYGDTFLFSYLAGDNVITNFRSNDTLKSTNGTLTYEKVNDDVVVTLTKSKTSGTVTLQGAADYNFTNKNNVLTVDAVNTIENHDADKKVTGTSGRDYITNDAEGVTIQSGKGNDTIDGSIFGETFMFSYAAGNNVITDFGVNDTLRNTSGTMTLKKNGDDYVVTIKKDSTSGTVTLKGAGDYNLVKSGNNIVVKNPPTVITNDKDKIKVVGTKEAEYIYNVGTNVTIQAGAGNDTIDGSNYGERFLFSYASGDDVILNFGLGDTIQSTTGTLSFKQSGDDYVVSIIKSGKNEVGTVTLKDAAENYTLQKSGSTYLVARPKSMSANVTEEEGYWFLDEAEAETPEESPLSEIVSTDASVELNDDLMSDALNRKSNALLSFAQHSRKNGIEK